MTGCRRFGMAPKRPLVGEGSGSKGVGSKLALHAASGELPARPLTPTPLPGGRRWRQLAGGGQLARPRTAAGAASAALQRF